MSSGTPSSAQRSGCRTGYVSRWPSGLRPGDSEVCLAPSHSPAEKTVQSGRHSDSRDRRTRGPTRAERAIQGGMTTRRQSRNQILKMRPGLGAHHPTFTLYRDGESGIVCMHWSHPGVGRERFLSRANQCCPAEQWGSDRAERSRMYWSPAVPRSKKWCPNNPTNTRTLTLQ